MRRPISTSPIHNSRNITNAPNESTRTYTVNPLKRERPLSHLHDGARVEPGGSSALCIFLRHPAARTYNFSMTTLLPSRHWTSICGYHARHTGNLCQFPNHSLANPRSAPRKTVSTTTVRADPVTLNLRDSYLRSLPGSSRAVSLYIRSKPYAFSLHQITRELRTVSTTSLSITYAGKASSAGILRFRQSP